MTLVLTPGSVTLGTLEKIYRGDNAVRLDPACDAAIEKAAARIAHRAA